MSIVPGRDVHEVPQAWVDAVNKAVNDANHEDLCHCDAWPTACQWYTPGQWDIGVDLDIAVGVLWPLIRDRIVMDARGPSKALVARQLEAAGHVQWTGTAGGIEGFQVVRNPSITPDGVAVLRRPTGLVAAALQPYADTLRALDYDAVVQELPHVELWGVYVKRPHRELRRG